MESIVPSKTKTIVVNLPDGTRKEFPGMNRAERRKFIKKNRLTVRKTAK